MGEPWPVDVLTAEYLISGAIPEDRQRWAFAYFSMVESNIPRALEVAVTGARATGARADPPLAGTLASFAYGTAFIALIPRGPAADKAWEKWAAAFGQPVAGEILIGPYAVTGGVLSMDGTMSPILNNRLAMRDATITRIDGAGDGAPIEAPRAVVTTAFVQLAAVSGSR
jgi:hypothetical protein